MLVTLMNLAKRQLLEEYISYLVIEQLANPVSTPAPLSPTTSSQLTGDWETGNLQQDADKVLQANKDKLAKKGINVQQQGLKVLGVGTMGVAYDLGNKVLKVTKDPREAKSSNMIKGKDIPNIVRIYDVWQFPGMNWYGLVMEKLTPLSKEEEKTLTDSVINTRFPLLLAKANEDWNTAMQELARQSMKEALQQAYREFPDAQTGQGIKDPRVQQFIRPVVEKKIADFNKLTKEYKMRELFKSLKSLGITYFDFHGGNYARRPDGTLVLIDLGRSISAGNLPATLQEAYKRMLVVLD